MVGMVCFFLGGFRYFCIFTTTWGFMIQFDLNIFFQMGVFFLKFVGLDWVNFPRLRNNGGARLEFLGVSFFRLTLDPDLQNPHWINPEKNVKFTKLYHFCFHVESGSEKTGILDLFLRRFCCKKSPWFLFTIFHQHEKGNLCFLFFPKHRRYRSIETTKSKERIDRYIYRLFRRRMNDKSRL